MTWENTDLKAHSLEFLIQQSPGGARTWIFLVNLYLKSTLIQSEWHTYETVVCAPLDAENNKNNNSTLFFLMK